MNWAMENFPVIYTLLFLQHGYPDNYARRQEDKNNPKKMKHVFTNEFFPCADIGMKTWGYRRIMRKLHAWSLLAKFVRAKTEDIGETVEGAYISYKYGTFRLNQCSWLKTLRRSLKGTGIHYRRGTFWLNHVAEKNERRLSRGHT